jgi:hypothetical protein
MLIGRDAGSTRMASTSALLSDEALQRRAVRMEKAKQGAAEPFGHRLVNRAYHCFSTARYDEQEPLRKLRVYNGLTFLVARRRQTLMHKSGKPTTQVGL